MTCLRYLAIVALSVMAVATTGSGQISKLPDIPETLSTSPQYVEFTKAHRALVERKNKLQSAAKAFNAKCAQVADGTPLAAECAREQAALNAVAESYSADVDGFAHSLAEAAIAQKAIKPVKVGSIGKGSRDWYMITVDGRKLSSDKLGSGDPIESGSRIVTGPNGHLQILLLDKTVFTIGPDGEMVMDDFVFDPSNSPRKVVVRLITGVLRWVTPKIPQARPENMRLDLHVGAIGPRGTDFETTVESDGSGSVRLFSGELDITEKKTGRTFRLAAQQKVAFTASGEFGRPEPFKAPDGVGK